MDEDAALWQSITSGHRAPPPHAHTHALGITSLSSTCDANIKEVTEIICWWIKVNQKYSEMWSVFQSKIQILIFKGQKLVPAILSCVLAFNGVLPTPDTSVFSDIHTRHLPSSLFTDITLPGLLFPISWPHTLLLAVKTTHFQSISQMVLKQTTNQFMSLGHVNLSRLE